MSLNGAPAQGHPEALQPQLHSCDCGLVCMCSSGVTVPMCRVCVVVLVVAEYELKRCDSVGFVGTAMSTLVCAHVAV